MEMVEVIQKVNLVDGYFTPSEASDIVGSLINEKINFHKIQRLGQLIHDEGCDTKPSDVRINELMEERKIAKEFIARSRVKGRNIRINCIMEIGYDDE